MMKKNGFTLAEVLITLTIIGVVAMMTLPALMTNVQEQQAVTGLKKGINTLTEAAGMNAAIAGFDYSGAVEDGTTADATSLSGLFLNRLAVDTKASGVSDTGLEITESGHKVVSGTTDGGTGYLVVFMKDGGAIAYNTGMKYDTTTQKLGMTVYYDINGVKGPNILSNCDGSQGVAKHIADGTTSGSGSGGGFTIAGLFGAPAYADPDPEPEPEVESQEIDDIDTSACDSKSNRIIRDQFALRLKGGYAYPGDAVSKWIMLNK